jgi:positive regulator of sigma E activity
MSGIKCSKCNQKKDCKKEYPYKASAKNTEPFDRVKIRGCV